MAGDVSSMIAEFVTSARYESMPAGALANARAAIQDCLGVSLAGSKAEDAEICADLVRAAEAREETSVYGRGLRSTALDAAFANGVAAHAEDFDHSFHVMGQPTAPIIPATFALAEALGSSGRQAIEAYVTGFEVTTALAFSLRGATGGGWHGNGTAGIFGATAACARLLGLDTRQVEMAVGITASLASGLSANFGTMTKPLHVGHAARNGVLAAKLAHAGYTASTRAMEAPRGYFASFYRGSTPNLQPFEDLGKAYVMETHGVRIKPYPCGGLTHTAIDAAVHLRERHNIRSEAVESVDVDAMEGTVNTIAFRVPATSIEGKFCMGYLIARALTDGNVTIDSFTEEAVRDPEVLSLVDRVTMRLDSSLEPGSGGERAARVTVHMRDGETYSELCREPKGGPKVPFSPAELDAKYRECAHRAIAGPAVEESLALLHDLDALPDVRPLCGLLRGEVAG
jgi:2-methylcitrate dehydratase PrpD